MLASVVNTLPKDKLVIIEANIPLKTQTCDGRI